MPSITPMTSVSFMIRSSSPSILKETDVMGVIEGAIAAKPAKKAA